jgi:cyclohexa-1,5-dienecarbonyl-CoA hydratase
MANKIEFNTNFGGQTVQIILNDEPGNVLDNEMMTGIKRSLLDLKDNRDIKLIVFEGKGEHFSFGASVEEHTKENAPGMLHAFHELFYIISQLGIPTLAKVSGQCLGGGMELALICNFIFADKSARFGQPEIVLGVIPPPASIILPLKIGNARAEEILLIGKPITGEKALTIGLVNRLFENKYEMDLEVNDWIKSNILKKSASSLRYGVQASRTFFNHILLKFLPSLEQMYVEQLMETHDANEGIESFLEKRKPVWTNN